MQYLKFIRKHFLAEVLRNKEISSELRNKLYNQNHPRLKVFFQNLDVQMVDAQKKRFKEGKPHWTHAQLAWSVAETTKVFIHGIEMAAKKMYETEAQRLKAQQLAQDEADMAATLEGKPQGAFKEMGLTINDHSKTIG